MLGHAGDRPGAEPLLQACDQARVADGEAEAQAGQAPELAQRFQDQRAGTGGEIGNARVGEDHVGEALVDHQERASGGLVGAREHVARGVVRMHRDARLGRVALGVAAQDLPAGGAKARLVLVVGAVRDAQAGSGDEVRDRRDQCRGAGRGEHRGALGHRPESPCRPFEPFGGMAVRQRRPGPGRDLGERVGVRVDAGREVEPVLPVAAMERDGVVQPAAVIARLRDPGILVARLTPGGAHSAASVSGSGGWRVTKCPFTACGHSR